MFGLGKSAAKPASTTKSKRKSSVSLPWKQWILNHVEKVGMAVFLLLTGYFVYDGLTSKSYSNPKTPVDLQNETRLVKTEISTVDHWDRLKDGRPVPSDFVKKVDDARKKMDPAPYATANIPDTARRLSGEKRGDPELFAPVDVRVSPFFGVIAINSPTPANADKLLNAPPVGDGKKARKPPTSSTPARTLSPVFDFGYKHQPGAASVPAPAVTPAPGRPPARPVELKVVPALKMFNIITAAVPHEKISKSYEDEFGGATDNRPERDSPNYIDYEVQRVDVTGNPERKIDEAEWQEAKGCLLEAQLKERKVWAGVCDEISLPNYIVPDVLTMPIPPILLSDYKKFATHPLIPHQIDESLPNFSPAGGDEPRSAGGDTPDSRSMVADGMNDGGSGQLVQAVEEDPRNIPKLLEKSEYKLLRFVDFNVENKHTYRYRVRLGLEDPNYTRSKVWTPRTQDLKPETVVRVQAKEAADNDAFSKLAPGAKFVRDSKLHTPWSEASPAVTLRRPVELYASQTARTFTEMKTPNEKSNILVDTMPPKATLVYAEWMPELGMQIPRRMEAMRGMLLSGSATVFYSPSLTENGLDAIDPVTKTIKWIPVSSPDKKIGFLFKTPVSIADVRGGLPLAAEKGRERDKDKLPSGGEVIAFDPDSDELVISREFESITPYQMLGFTNETAAPP